MNLINGLFASLPYDFWKRDDEHFFHAIIHLTFSLLGVHVQSEVHTSRGRCDALVQTPEHIYAFEFKRDIPRLSGLATDRRTGLSCDPFAADVRKKVAVGVVLDSDSKQIKEWKSVTNKT